ncbi:WD repeat protein Lub1 [Pleurotus ostreatus]|nr:WD repeat protein Lub1 [Pleurotus ostreatus]
MPYKLSATLAAHSADVRAVASPSNDLVLSASRDSTAISWQRSTDEPIFVPANILRAGSRYVNSIAYIPPTPDVPKGYVVTGGQDTVVNVFRLDNPGDDPDFSLLGHTENVCALDTTASGVIISGSWDRTAKVWSNFALTYDLKGHQQSVWAVLAIDEQQFLTGSADKTIKIWKEHKCIQTYQGHRDAVRGLVLIPDIGFASCSNDSEIRVWTLGGDVVYTLSGHTSFVYSLSVLPNGDIVSGGEDRSVRVWRDGECSQTIVHPAISVWAVSSMPNGDIVSGCSDGVVRIFSASEERWASAEDLSEYEQRVASTALPVQQVGDVKKSDLPGLEALDVPGKKSGEVKMVKNGALVEAHQWDSASNAWQKIGDVVDAVGQGRKQLYQGKEYDYVFDVDIQDGVPPLKLPYNVTENPYSSAQRFLAANELPLTYLDEVVRFIERNTAGVNIGTSGSEYVDPYTGASRYQSSVPSAPQADTSMYVDPYTGASRYTGTPASAPSSTPATNYMDPFTGASRYSGAPAPAQVAPVAPAILPVPKAITFKQANVAAMQNKVQQFDDDLKNEISTSSLAMYPEEATALEEIFSHLTPLLSTPPRRPAAPLSERHVDAIIQILGRWPISQRFPVIDLSRLLTGFCPSVFSAPGLRERFLEALFEASDWSSSWSTPLPKPRETNILLLLRTLANSFQEGTRLDEGTWPTKVFEGLSQAPYTTLNKTHRVVLATILFNVSCLALSAPSDASIRSKHISLILRILETERSDSEAVYRALVALGNMVRAATSWVDHPSLGMFAIFRLTHARRMGPRSPRPRLGKLSSAYKLYLVLSPRTEFVT